jgi:hypothetical protein
MPETHDERWRIGKCLAMLIGVKFTPRSTCIMPWRSRRLVTCVRLCSCTVRKAEATPRSYVIKQEEDGRPCPRQMNDGGFFVAQPQRSNKSRRLFAVVSPKFMIYENRRPCTDDHLGLAVTPMGNCFCAAQSPKRHEISCEMNAH